MISPTEAQWLRAPILWQRLSDLIVHPGADVITVIAAGSRAEVPRHGPARFGYGGAADVWSVVEEAHTRWRELDRPDIDRYGITATPGGQWMWVDTADQPITIRFLG